MLGNRHSSEQLFLKLREVKVTLTRSEIFTQTDSGNRTGPVRLSHENQRLRHSICNRQVTDAIKSLIRVRSFKTESNSSTCHAH